MSFKTIRDALQFNDNCPLCKKQLVYNDNSPLISGNDIYYFLNSLEDDLVFIDIDTSVVKIENSTGADHNGIFMASLRAACYTCGRYSHTLQLVVNLTTLKLEDILVNSQSFEYNDSLYHYNFTNKFSQEKTLVGVFEKKTPTLIVQMNLNNCFVDSANLNKVAEKVRNLILYS